MTEQTALTTTEEVGGRPLTELVSEGAALEETHWPTARIAAARSLLPEGYRDAASMIAFLARAQRSGLDPFLNELWAWKDRGNLIFMTGRDGWLSLARRDDTIEHVECGLVYDGDKFSSRREGGAVMIQHEGGIKTKPLAVMAYAVVHYTNGTSGELERRTFEDYEHLLSKSNWKQDMNGMLLTRTVSAAIKFATPRAAGLASPAHMGEDVPDASIVSEQMQRLTEKKTDRIRRKLAEKRPPAEASQGREIEVEPKPEPDPEPAAPEEPEEEEETKPCPFCEQEFAPKSMGGHMRSHAEEREKAEALEGGYRIERRVNDEGSVYFEGYTPDDDEPLCGYTSWLATWTKLAQHAEEAFHGESEAAEEPPAEEEVPDEEPREFKAVDIFQLCSEHGLDDSLPSEIINLEKWDHIFGPFRREGAEQVNIFDLDADARRALYEIIAEQAQA